jgi:hypothetical protein
MTLSTLFCGALCLGLPDQHHQKAKKFQKVDSSPDVINCGIVTFGQIIETIHPSVSKNEIMD